MWQQRLTGRPGRPAACRGSSRLLQPRHGSRQSRAGSACAGHASTLETVVCRSSSPQAQCGLDGGWAVECRVVAGIAPGMESSVTHGCSTKRCTYTRKAALALPGRPTTCLKTLPPPRPSSMPRFRNAAHIGRCTQRHARLSGHPCIQIRLPLLLMLGLCPVIRLFSKLRAVVLSALHICPLRLRLTPCARRICPYPIACS